MTLETGRVRGRTRRDRQGHAPAGSPMTGGAGGLKPMLAMIELDIKAAYSGKSFQRRSGGVTDRADLTIRVGELLNMAAGTG